MFILLGGALFHALSLSFSLALVPETSPSSVHPPPTKAGTFAEGENFLPQDERNERKTETKKKVM